MLRPVRHLAWTRALPWIKWLQGQAGNMEKWREPGGDWANGQACPSSKAVILSGPSPLWNTLSVSQEKKKKSAFYLKFCGFYSLTRLIHIFKKHWTRQNTTTTTICRPGLARSPPTCSLCLGTTGRPSAENPSLASIRVWFTFQAVDRTDPRDGKACGS